MWEISFILFMLEVDSQKQVELLNKHNFRRIQMNFIKFAPMTFGTCPACRIFPFTGDSCIMSIPKPKHLFFLLII